MSCNSNCYLPIPPRAWSRVQNNCSLIDNIQGDNQVQVPYSGRTVPASTLYLEYAMLNKGNVLQYKKNSSNLTKQQRYSQIAKGLWTNRNTTWATQSTRGYTNPNNQSLQRVGSINITLAGVPTSAPVTCPKNKNIVNDPLPPAGSGGSGNPETLPPPPPPTDTGILLPDETIIEPPVEPIVIQDLGNLVCGTQENVCTGEIIRQPTDIICHPTTDSDVPGPIMELCWNDGTPTWYPRQRYVMSNSGNKWPVNATLLSAINILAPVITSITNVDNVVTLTWTQDERCIPAAEFTIYENGIPVKIVSGTTFKTTIVINSSNGEYVFYIVASNTTLISDPSNSVSIIVNNSCYYSIFGEYSIMSDNTSYTITFSYNPANANSIQLGCTVNNVSITLVGGGGGGGRGRVNNTDFKGGGGGGGGGGINTGTVNLTPDVYNIIVGYAGKGSINSSDSLGQFGGDSYIQNSSFTNIAIAYGGGGGASMQQNQINQSSGGIGGGPDPGGYGGKGGYGGGAGNNGLPGTYPYSGGGGGGCGTDCCGGEGGENGTGGAGGCTIYYYGSSGLTGHSYGAGGGGGGGNNGNGGDGNYGVIILVIQKI